MALVKLFDDRQLAVEEATITYLVPRIDRSLRMARTVVEAIDRAAVTDQKRVTRSMAADVLAGLG
jgi:chromosomal replication initiation ATPase DnaA